VLRIYFYKIYNKRIKGGKNRIENREKKYKRKKEKVRVLRIYFYKIYNKRIKEKKGDK